MSVVIPNRYDYEFVPASQTNQKLGTIGARGDYLHRLVISVDTPASAAISLVDGPNVIPLQLGAAGIGRGVFSIEINAASRFTGWGVTTGPGATVLAVGIFN